MRLSAREVEIMEMIIHLPRYDIEETSREQILQNVALSVDSQRAGKPGNPVLRRKLVIGLASFFVLLGTTVSVASANGMLSNIIGKFRPASHSGILTSIEFQGSQSNPYGNEVAGPFQSANSLAQLHMLFPSFPKITLPGWKIAPPLGGQRYSGNDEWVSISTSSGINVNAYHDLTRTMVIDGMSVTSPQVETTTLDGVEAKIFVYHAGTGGISYIVWKRGTWTIALNTMSTSKDELLTVAQTFDEQFRKGMN